MMDLTFNPSMRKRPFSFGLVLGIPLGWGLLLGLFLLIRLLLGFDDPKLEAFREIKPGMPKAEVIRLMGEEGKRSETFYLGQKAGFEFEYAVAERIGAAYFVMWKVGLDGVIAVAFDNQDRVIYKASGGT